MLLVLAGSTYCHAQVIDDFSESPISLNRAEQPVSVFQTSLNPDSVVGGTRDILLGEFGGSGQFVEISDGSIAFGSAEGGLSYLTLTYGSDDSPLGLDLSLTGHDRFFFEGFSGNTPGFFVLSSTGGDSSASLGLLTPERPFLLFSDFGSGANFSEINSIEFRSVRNGQPVGFNGIATAVPEPSSTLCGIICCVFIAMRRRRAQ